MQKLFDGNPILTNDVFDVFSTPRQSPHTLGTPHGEIELRTSEAIPDDEIHLVGSGQRVVIKLGAG